MCLSPSAGSPVVKWLSLLTLNQASPVRIRAGEGSFLFLEKILIHLGVKSITVSHTHCPHSLSHEARGSVNMVVVYCFFPSLRWKIEWTSAISKFVADKTTFIAFEVLHVLFSSKHLSHRSENVDQKEGLFAIHNPPNCMRFNVDSFTPPFCPNRPSMFLCFQEDKFLYKKNISASYIPSDFVAPSLSRTTESNAIFKSSYI